ncbi:MAG: hypothetical protein JWO83_1919 [Caulobacteraceae bacterium]|jgi:hypothetical protein|nr:hypothetical protein [Caulobacteraceae bacterium]
MTSAKAIVIAALAALLAGAAARAQTSPPEIRFDAVDPLVLIDGTVAPARPGMAILTRGERIRTTWSRSIAPPISSGRTQRADRHLTASRTRCRWATSPSASTPSPISACGVIQLTYNPADTLGDGSWLRGTGG